MKLLVFGSLNIDNTYDVDHTVKQGRNHFFPGFKYVLWRERPESGDRTLQSRC